MIGILLVATIDEIAKDAARGRLRQSAPQSAEGGTL